MSENKNIILGIDPGSNMMGFGVIDATTKKPGFIDMGFIDFRKDGDHYEKLSSIFKSTIKLIDNYRPGELAIEAPFYGKNVQSMLKLGRAQGAAIAAALNKEMPVFEYAPRKIKLAITGVGQASKEQVSGMLAQIFQLKTMPENLDASDGLAVAVCHFYENTPGKKKTTNKSWGDFIRNNPDRLK